MPDYFDLDILSQQQRINSLYTQITFCFKCGDNAQCMHEVVKTLKEAAIKLSESFPCLAGHVVPQSGLFRIESLEQDLSLIVKDYTDSPSYPSWSELQKSNFPFHMLDESWLSPVKTFASADAFLQRPNVFMVQANFITSGLLLTFNGLHGAMDIAGMSVAIDLFAKACRHELFTEEELAVGNTDRRTGITVPPTSKTANERPDGARPSVANQVMRKPTLDQPLEWGYFSISGSSLARLKASATKCISGQTFVSTDDVLTALTWQSVTRVLSSRLSPSAQTCLSRNVDMRRYLNLPATYPSYATGSTTHTWSIAKLVSQPVGSVADELRCALNRDALLQDFYSQLRSLQEDPNRTTRVKRGANPGSVEVRLSSWAKELCSAMNFGSLLDRPDAIRRPRFLDGAREGLVYFLPKTREGEILVGVCLTKTDLEALGLDADFGDFAEYVG